VKDPRKKVHSARRAWNEAGEKEPYFPQTRIPSPEDSRCYALPWTSFPLSLQEEVRAYKQARLSAGPLDIFDDGRLIKPRTLNQQLELLRRYASKLVLDEVPIESLISFPVVLESNLAKQGLETLLTAEGAVTPKATATAHALVSIARFIKLPDEQIERLAKYAENLRVRPVGMNPKNRERLAPLKAEEVKRKLLNLPSGIALDCVSAIPTYALAVRMRLAIAVEVLKYGPMRVFNLANLDFERHFSCPKGNEIVIYIPKHEVKNHRELIYTLPKTSSDLIWEYRRRFRPLFCAGQSSALFPGRDGDPIDSHHLGRCIKDGIKRELGLIMNAHLFRHFAAFLYLSAHPGDYETVRRMLGHKSIQTTISFYAEIEQAVLSLQWQETILSHTQGNAAALGGPF